MERPAKAKKENNGSANLGFEAQMFLATDKMRGSMEDHTRPELTEADIKKIGDIYNASRGEKSASQYENVPGFCKLAQLEEIETHSFVLTPSHYVDSESVEDDGEPFEVKFPLLIAKSEIRFVESDNQTAPIRRNLKILGSI